MQLYRCSTTQRRCYRHRYRHRWYATTLCVEPTSFYALPVTVVLFFCNSFFSFVVIIAVTNHSFSLLCTSSTTLSLLFSSSSAGFTYVGVGPGHVHSQPSCNYYWKRVLPGLVHRHNLTLFDHYWWTDCLGSSDQWCLTIMCPIPQSISYQ